MRRSRHRVEIRLLVAGVALVVAGVSSSSLSAASGTPLLRPYHLQATKTCLLARKVIVAELPPDKTLRSFGVTAALDANFVLLDQGTPPPEANIWFTRSAAAAKDAKVGILRWVRKLTGEPVPASLVSVRNDVLVFWVVRAESAAPSRVLLACLSRSV